MQVNDGTKPCPTCLNATNISTLKAVADMREEERKNALVVLQLDRDLSALREAAAAYIEAVKSAPLATDVAEAERALLALLPTPASK